MTNLAMKPELIPETFNYTVLENLSREDQYLWLGSQIGDTPLVPAPTFEGQVMMKAECANPSGSHYDRAYLQTIMELEQEGLIRPGDELRDITSGSAGISLSMIGSALGYHIRVTVPDELPESRVKPMQDWQAEVVRCGSGYIRRASEFQYGEIVDFKRSGWSRIRSQNPNMRAVIFENGDKRICYLNHSENQTSPDSFSNIAVELDIAFQDQNKPSAIALAMGNFTTIAGIAPVIRELWPEAEIIGYEGTARDIHTNFGTTVDGIPLRFKDLSLLDQTMAITDDERDGMDERVNPHLAAEQRLGHSSLMGLVVAGRILTSVNGPVVTIAYDHKSRY